MIRADGISYPPEASPLDSLSISTEALWNPRTFDLAWDPSTYHLGTILSPYGGEALPHSASVSIGNSTVKEVNLKASQVISRIEAAGWKKIRSEGSHVIFEHPKFGRRSTAFGRPQRDVNKRRLLEVVEDFHLVEIEQAKIAARLEEAKRRPEPARVTLARVIPDSEIVLTPQDVQLLVAQLRKEHGLTEKKVATEAGLEAKNLAGYIHYGIELSPAKEHLLKVYLTAQEKRLKLTRDRDELIKKGYGVRTGAHNAADPFILQARELLLKTLNAGVMLVDLAETIGIGPHVIHGIKTGRVKTIHPDAKSKIQHWIKENWSEPEEKPEPPQEQLPSHEVEAREYAASQSPFAIDDELMAIQTVLKAVQPLNQATARRALRYVLERME